jgi:DmsE family decaheme c-type cytochrome
VAAEEAEEAPAAYTPAGADTCLRCHDEGAEFPVLSIFKTPHAQRADPRTPFAQLQCESCHGPGGDHGGRVRRGEPRPPILNFGRHAAATPAEQNAMCLDCHRGTERVGWHGSAHDNADLPCASCHVVHAREDKALTQAGQPEVCYTCHTRERAEAHMAFTHPIRYGQMACSDCHAPHGAPGEPLLVKPTINETCYTCHAEKRGPFLWEHAPAAEDCTLCHKPHGSSYPALLTQHAPLLCQQCHSQAGHPSVSHTAAGLPSGNPSGFLLVQGCANCHSRVHGSNHPSGAKLMR